MWYLCLLLCLGGSATAWAQKKGTSKAITRASSGLRIVVSPNGDDQAAGTLADPIRTVFEAQARVREMLAQASGPDIEVLMQPGTYRIDQPWVIGPEDSHPDRKVTWQAPLGTKATISGGKRLLGWEPMAGGLWRVPLKEAKFRQLYINGQRRLRARMPMPGDLQLTLGIDSIPVYSSRYLSHVTEGNSSEHELHYKAPNGTTIVPLEKLVTDSTGITRLYPNAEAAKLITKKEGHALTMPHTMEGAFTLVDQPGEWYYSAKDGYLYYLPMPSEDLTEADVTIPVLDTLLVLEGQPGETVTNLLFKNLTFADANWSMGKEGRFVNVYGNMRMDADHADVIDGKYRGHLYAEYKPTPAHIQMSYTDKVTFFGCRFTRMGSMAMHVGVGSQNNLIEYCLFEDISGNALQLGEVTRAGHHPNAADDKVVGNKVRNCLVRRIGCEFDGAIGLLLAYAERTTLELNEFTQLPYVGIQLGWGWGRTDSGGLGKQPRIFTTRTSYAQNIIKGNRVHKCMLKYTDGGAITTHSDQGNTLVQDNMLYTNGGNRDLHLGPGTARLSLRGNRPLGEGKLGVTYDVRDERREKTITMAGGF